jgi:hypothetical protein
MQNDVQVTRLRIDFSVLNTAKDFRVFAKDGVKLINRNIGRATWFYLSILCGILLRNLRESLDDRHHDIITGNHLRATMLYQECFLSFSHFKH